MSTENITGSTNNLCMYIHVLNIYVHTCTCTCTLCMCTDVLWTRRGSWRGCLSLSSTTLTPSSPVENCPLSSPMMNWRDCYRYCSYCIYWVPCVWQVRVSLNFFTAFCHSSTCIYPHGIRIYSLLLDEWNCRVGVCFHLSWAFFSHFQYVRTALCPLIWSPVSCYHTHVHVHVHVYT